MHQISKWSNKLDKQLSKEERQMTIKYIKRYSTSLGTGGVKLNMCDS